jgi:hypothetical protein
VRRAGVEPAKPEAGGLRPLGLSNARPTHRYRSAPDGSRTRDLPVDNRASLPPAPRGRCKESGPGGSRTHRRLLLRQVALPVCLPGHMQFRGQESNLRPPGSEPGVTTSSNCPGIGHLLDTSSYLQVRGGGFEPPQPAPKASGLPLADPRECPAGVEPACPAWEAGASAARPRAREAEGEGVEPPRLIARPFSRRVPSPIGLPFRSVSTEGRNRTSAEAVNSRRPVPALAPSVPMRSVGAAGFEPALSWSQARRIPAFLRPVPLQVPSGSRTRTSAMARR